MNDPENNALLNVIIPMLRKLSFIMLAISVLNAFLREWVMGVFLLVFSGIFYFIYHCCNEKNGTLDK